MKNIYRNNLNCLKMILDIFFKKKETAPIIKYGRWKEFNKHAVLIAEGHYVNDKKHGLWREYFDSGELMIEESFMEGISHGRYATFHRNGIILSEGKFVLGSREGEFKVYDNTGNHIKSLMFTDNILMAELDLKCV